MTIKLTPHGLIADSSASTVRILANDPHLQSDPSNDPVDAAPVLTGPHGRAWLADIEATAASVGKTTADFAALAHWIIEAPWAHPVWHSYFIGFIHLRPMKAIPREPHIYLSGATHELMVHALDPDAPREPLVAGANIGTSILLPANFAAQFIEISDDLAIERVSKTVQMILDGALSPDTDSQRHWVKLYGNNMIKPEYR